MLLDDVRDGLRLLLHFPVAAVLALALGTGVKAPVFSVLNVFVLKPLAYEALDRVAFVLGWEEETHQRLFNLPVVDVSELRQ